MGRRGGSDRTQTSRYYQGTARVERLNYKINPKDGDNLLFFAVRSFMAIV
jgi:hypothetical protein